MTKLDTLFLTKKAFKSIPFEAGHNYMYNAHSLEYPLSLGRVKRK